MTISKIIANQDEIAKLTTRFEILALTEETKTLASSLIDCNPEPVPEDFYIIDISHHNNNVNWQELKANGVKAVYIRLSYGMSPDNAFSSHFFKARGNGFKVGAYHFLDTRYSAIEQANVFISQLALWTLDMPPAIDVESADFMPFPTFSQVRAFNDRLAQVRSHRVIYTSVSIYDRISVVDNLGCDLWVAHYGVSQPTIPKAWQHWELWQFTSKGIDGNSHLDVNRFNGTYDDFVTWLSGNTPQPPPPSGKLDVWSYMRPNTDNVTYEVKHYAGSQERIQNQHGGNGDLFVVKGENQGYYEQWSLNGNLVHLVMDTSPSNDSQNTPRYYKVFDGAWCNRYMAVGETFNDGGHYVQFYAKSDCGELSENSGNATNNNKLIAYHPTVSFTAGEKPIILQDVIEIGNVNGERHWFAKGIGRVKWTSMWGSSEISELHNAGDRPVINREVINCL